jgi:hypothetical protein
MNHFRFMKIQSIYQLFCSTCFTRLSIPIFYIPCRFQLSWYTHRMDRTIPCKFSSFSIRDATSRSTLPTSQALRPNTFNNCSEANFTKAGFGNGGHYFVPATRFFHSRCALARAQLATFWSFHLCIAIAFCKMRAFILAWSWCRGPLATVEGLPGLAFSATKPCTSFKCLVNSHFAQYTIV